MESFGIGKKRPMAKVMGWSAYMKKNKESQGSSIRVRYT